MHLSISTPPAAAVLTFLLLSNPASTQSTAKSECVRTRSQELASLAACGHPGSLDHCFGSLGEFFMQADLEACFVNAGCTADEAAIEAIWTLRRCESPENLSDLRKRQKNQPSENTDTDTPTSAESTQEAATSKATEKTTAKTPAKTTAETTAETPSKTDQPSTTDQPTQTSATSADDSTTATAGGSTTSDQSTTGTQLTCIITTTISTSFCPIQTTGPSSGQTLPCFPTQVSFPTCSPGLYCSTDNHGNPTCMVFDNTLDTAGVIVALFFSVAITAAIALITFLCCRDKALQRKQAAKAEAAAIAKAAKEDGSARSRQAGMRNVSAQSNTSADDRAPLIKQQTGSAPVEMQVDPFDDRHQS